MVRSNSYKKSLVVIKILLQRSARDFGLCPSRLFRNNAYMSLKLFVLNTNHFRTSSFNLFKKFNHGDARSQPFSLAIAAKCGTFR
jgi:hypothetical protein